MEHQENKALRVVTNIFAIIFIVIAFAYGLSIATNLSISYHYCENDYSFYFDVSFDAYTFTKLAPVSLTFLVPALLIAMIWFGSKKHEKLLIPSLILTGLFNIIPFIVFSGITSLIGYSNAITYNIPAEKIKNYTGFEFPTSLICIIALYALLFFNIVFLVLQFAYMFRNKKSRKNDSEEQQN